MKRIGDLMPEICTFDNALLAYKKARACKRYRPEVMEYEQNREMNLLRAIDILENLTYNPGKYKIFKVWEPKERVIMALPFSDRVVQHMIVNIIEPIFEKRFIYHSYACRKDKGAHKASKQLSHWLHGLEIIDGKRIYVLKCDIHRYFQSVDHGILKEEIRHYIKDNELLTIIDRIIDRNGIFPDGTGIPVGNLTSQLFANVYLHKLDIFVKNNLKADKYERYMDDFILLSDDIDELREWRDAIEQFLIEEMLLHLNPKTTIVCAKNGVDFVGYRHWNETVKVRKGALRRLNRLISNFENGLVTEEFFDQSFQSRMGSMKHADTYALRQKYEATVFEIKKCLMEVA